MKKLLFIFLLLGIITIANADDGMLNATYISSIFNLAETVWVKIAVNNSIKIFTVNSFLVFRHEKNHNSKI